MLNEQEQKLLLKLLKFKRLTKKDFLGKKLCGSESHFYCITARLGSYGLIHGSHYWELTFKGLILAKLLALLPNNDEDYTKYTEEEIIEFEYCPDH